VPKDNIAMNKTTVSIEEYRKLTGDATSPDDLVLQRITYIERLCRGVIVNELQKLKG
jgi:hypothetical protein